MKFEATLSPEVERLTGRHIDVVEVSDIHVEYIKNLAIRDFADAIILKYADMYLAKYDYDELTEDEAQELLEDYHVYTDCGISNPDDLVDGIATGKLQSLVEESVQDMVEHRVKFYNFNIHYEGNFSICLNAHNEDQPREYLGRMYPGDFEDYISAEDTEVDVDEAELLSVEDDVPWDVIDGTDD